MEKGPRQGLAAPRASRRPPLSKKHKHHHGSFGLSIPELRARAERARSEGRFQQCLELAKQVHKAEPTPAHRTLLEEAYLGRARQLRAQNHLRDAVTVLEAAVRVDENDATWVGKLAAEIARCGEPTRAMALLAKLPAAAGTGSAALVSAAVADSAVAAEGATR